MRTNPVFLIHFDPRRFDDDDLGQLGALAQVMAKPPASFPAAREHAPKKLAAWLSEVLDAEQYRRAQQEESDEHLEPTLPKINIQDWDYREISSALQAVSTLTYGKYLTATVGEFLDKVAQFFVNLACATLKEIQDELEAAGMGQQP
jgi:hypothetical protein